MRQPAPVVKLKPNDAKIVEAIILLISRAEIIKKTLTQYDVVKSIFLADRRHLNLYGRPVTFDNYVAMEHGPVPSRAYDILRKPPPMSLWHCLQGPKSKLIFSSPTREYDPDILSPSDVEVLNDALTDVFSLGFSQVRKLTHDDAAYIDAWMPEDTTRKAFDMSLSLLFDIPDQEKALHLAHSSLHI